MPNAKAVSKKSKPARTKGSPPRRLPQRAVLFVIAALVLLISLLAVTGYRNQESRKKDEATLAADKATFAQIETDMASTYQAIVAAAGEPTAQTDIRNCARVSHKYETGDLYCNAGFLIEYEFSAVDALNERLIAIDQALISKGLKAGNKSIQVSELDTDSAVTAKLTNLRGASCDQYVETTYDNVQKEYATKQQIMCSKKVTEPVFMN